MNRCLELTASRVAARRLGVLDEDEGAELDAHLASCEPCTAFAGDVTGALDELGVPEEAPDVWGKIEEELDRVEGKAPVVALACTYCKDRLVREQAAFCAKCLAPHHAECFREHGRCSACRERRFVQPSAPVAPRWQRAARPILLLAIGAGAAAAAFAGRGERERPPLVSGPLVVDGTVILGGAPSVTSSGGVLSFDEPKVAPLRARDEPLRDVLARLNAQDARLRAFTNVPDLRVTVEVAGAEWREALAAIAKAVGAEVRELGGDAFLVDKQPRITASFANEDVGAVMERIAAAEGKQLVFGPARSTRVSLELHDVTWVDALATIAKTAGCSLQRRKDALLCSPLPLRWGSEKIAEAEVGCWRVVRDRSGIAVLATRTPAERRTFVAAVDATVDGFARLVAAAEGRSVAVAVGNAPPVTMRLEDVPWIDALGAGLGVAGFGVATEANGSVRVCDVSHAGPLPAPAERPTSRAPEEHVLRPSTTLWSRGLTGIAIDHEDPSRRFALVHDFLVRAGDRIRSGNVLVKVVAIEPEGVVYERLETGSRWCMGLAGTHERVSSAPPLPESVVSTLVARVDALMEQTAFATDDARAAFIAQCERLLHVLDDLRPDASNTRWPRWSGVLELVTKGAGVRTDAVFLHRFDQEMQDVAAAATPDARAFWLDRAARSLEAIWDSSAGTDADRAVRLARFHAARK